MLNTMRIVEMEYVMGNKPYDITDVTTAHGPEI